MGLPSQQPTHQLCHRCSDPPNIVLLEYPQRLGEWRTEGEEFLVKHVFAVYAAQTLDKGVLFGIT